ncbi:glycogen synthase kinase mutation revertant protein [Stemphylium lycopersici]|uniref:Glycogen synthase kinase mutation revertant protein n=1 Tax=Stemphylium lycopersici TaxID=183478 RepID=A0A364N3A9_STELY|nr:glycogen synthase kinase mutation revertant protein [Stemphylium lycopersici]RAR01615.1 glycogen synthase kinase mutation revertant protein [Stemphylium lycopersici]RAR10205.1 glycogen synthase kinase mutation revertant protein [Stemphylium lycopersici]
MVSTNDTTEPREITASFRDEDGTSEFTITLQENSDATKPPSFVKISKRSTTPPNAPDTSSQRETHVVLSVGSGDRQAENFFQNVVTPILSTAIYGDEGLSNLKIHTTTSATTISELTQNTFFPAANSKKPLRIILLSGDGGIVDLVNGLLSQPQSDAYISPEVVLLPLGTANALYHSINAGKSMTWGIDALSPSTTIAKPLPVFTATFSPGARLLVDEARSEEALPKNDQGNGILHGAVVASWGMHASLVGDSDTAHYRQYGVERFKMAAKEALYPADGSLPHPYKASVSVLKGGEWKEMEEKEHMYVLATLVSNLEQPFCISPKSRPLDGSMHLVHFGPRSGDDVMRIMGLAYQGGKHVDDEHVRYESIDGLRIQFQGMEEEAKWRRICIDGKIVRVDANGWVEITKDEKRVLDVVVA